MTGYVDPIGECRITLADQSFKLNFNHENLPLLSRAVRSEFGQEARVFTLCIGSYDPNLLGIMVEVGTDWPGYQKLTATELPKLLNRACAKDRLAWRDVWNTVAGCVYRLHVGDGDKVSPGEPDAV